MRIDPKTDKVMTSVTLTFDLEMSQEHQYLMDNPSAANNQYYNNSLSRRDVRPASDWLRANTPPSLARQPPPLFGGRHSSLNRTLD